MKIRYLLVLAIAFILSACNSAAEPVTLSQSAAEVTQVETLDLPRDVDVNTTASLRDRDDILLIDVREQWEYDEGHIPGITLIPMSEIEDRLDEIPTDKEVIVTCRSGNRSGQVSEFLQQKGFENIHNMQGGILAWQDAGYEVER